jgi:hypothetical protein
MAIAVAWKCSGLCAGAGSWLRQEHNIREK